MRKLMIMLTATVAICAVGVPLWQAQAASFGDPAITSKLKNYTSIEPAACRGWGRWCGPGRVRVCGRWRCWCALC
jgi:hypothetical protein